MDSFTTPQVPEYTVPSVLGKTVEEALEMAEIDGIFTIVEEKYDYSDEYAADQIIDQDPAEGRVKKKDGEQLIPINVTVSLGVRSGGMPYLIGEEGRSARLILEQSKELSDLHLEIVEGESENSDTIEEGHVIRTIPAAGESLSEGDTVTLILSLGPKIKYSVMVPCVGQSMEWVQQEMNRLNLVAEFQPVEGSQDEGTVLSQSVDVGESVPEGTTVTFTYSDGQKEIQQTVSVNVSESEPEVKVEIFLDNTVIFESELPGDYGLLEVPVFAKAGSYQLRIFINDQLREDRVITFSE